MDACRSGMAMRTENLLRLESLFNHAGPAADGTSPTLSDQWIGTDVELSGAVQNDLELSAITRIPEWMVSADFRVHRAHHAYSAERSKSPAMRRRVLQLALDEGLTICLYAVQKFSPAVQQLSASLRERLDATVSASMLVSRGPATGLPAHYDRDPIVVQHVVGRKRWTVWPDVGPSQVGDSQTLSDDELSHRSGFDCELAAGDLMFLPAGAAHATSTPAGTISVHLAYDCRPFPLDPSSKQ